MKDILDPQRSRSATQKCNLALAQEAIPMFAPSCQHLVPKDLVAEHEDPQAHAHRQGKHDLEHAAGGQEQALQHEPQLAARELSCVLCGFPRRHYGCGAKLNRRGKPQVLVHVSTYQGSILVPFFWSHSLMNQWLLHIPTGLMCTARLCIGLRTGLAGMLACVVSAEACKLSKGLAFLPANCPLSHSSS